jgi:hypothetical protein
MTTTRKLLPLDINSEEFRYWAGKLQQHVETKRAIRRVQANARNAANFEKHIERMKAANPTNTTSAKTTTTAATTATEHQPALKSRKGYLDGSSQH